MGYLDEKDEPVKMFLITGYYCIIMRYNMVIVEKWFKDSNNLIYRAPTK